MGGAITNESASWGLTPFGLCRMKVCRRNGADVLGAGLNCSELTQGTLRPRTIKNSPARGAAVLTRSHKPQRQPISALTPLVMHTGRKAAHQVDAIVADFRVL